MTGIDSDTGADHEDELLGAAAGMDVEALQALYARLTYAFRESRKAVLNPYAVADEAALLESIRSGQLAEHPAYEHYLTARILDQTRCYLREELVARMDAIAQPTSGGKGDAPAPTPHLDLQEKITSQYASRLAEPVRMAQDALLLSLDNGVLLEARIVSDSEYAYHWAWGEASMRIDTAPVHGERLSHWHDDQDGMLDDPITLPGRNYWQNFSNLLDRLLVNPLLVSAEDANSEQ